MKIAVTGASGYLGTGVVKQLCDDGNDVIAACHSASNLIDCRATVKVGDIFLYDNPFEELGKPELLLHMAWRNGFVHNDPSHIEDLPKHFEFIKKMTESGVSKLQSLALCMRWDFLRGV